ncbi:hypothetical protein AUP68_15366 [Ilyonectria robusta]
MSVEPVGATLGLLGLVGTVVEAIHFGYAVKDMTGSLRTARMKLDLEGSLLQSWAENVLLDEEGLAGGVRVIPASIAALVRETLEELLRLFNESSGIVDKYVSQKHVEPLSIARQTVGPGNLFRWLSVKQVPRPKAIKWAIRDGPRLEGLISDIDFFQDKLHKRLPLNMELFRLQILVDTVAESTVDHLEVLRKAAGEIMNNRPADAPAMQSICAAALIRENLPRWELDVAHLNDYMTTLKKDMAAFGSNPPADMTLWRTQLRDTGQPVMVEWRPIELRPAQDGLFERDVVQMANLLSSLDRHPDAHLPTCLGYVKQSNYDGSRPRYGLVFSATRGEAAISQTDGPPTLFKAIQDSQHSSKLPDVADRLRMTLALSISVARSDANGQVSRDPAVSRSFDSYRHPAGVSIEWGTQRYMQAGGYRREFDIYSLGAVMAEIGLWHSLEYIRGREDAKRQRTGQPALSAVEWSAFLRGKVRDEMPGAMGGRVAAVVDWCLGVGAGMNPQPGHIGSLLSGFEECVLRPLMAFLGSIQPWPSTAYGIGFSIPFWNFSKPRNTAPYHKK